MKNCGRISFKSTGREFIEAKLAERAERHKRQGGQRYVLEPNVKEAKGGLARSADALLDRQISAPGAPRPPGWWRPGF